MPFAGKRLRRGCTPAGAPVVAAAGDGRLLAGPPPTPRLLGADLVRAAAVVGVVVIHAAHWPGTRTPDEAWLWHGITLLARCAVPLFVLLTGALLEIGRHGGNGVSEAPLMLRLRVRLSRSLVPWLLWAPLYLVAGLLLTGEVTRSWWGVGDWLLGGGGHLYYLLLVPQLALAVVLWPRALRAQLALAAGALAVQVALDVARLHVSPGGGVTAWVMLWHADEELPFWIGFLAIGIAGGHLIARGWRPDRPRLLAAALVLLGAAGAFAVLRTPGAGSDTVAFADGTGAFLRPGMPLLVVPVAGLLALAAPLLARRRLASTAVRRIARHALGIYVVQALVIYLPGRALFGPLQGGLVDELLAFPVLVVVTLVGSLFATEALARGPLAVVVGERPTGGATVPAEAPGHRIGRDASCSR